MLRPLRALGPDVDTLMYFHLFGFGLCRLLDGFEVLLRQRGIRVAPRPTDPR